MNTTILGMRRSTMALLILIGVGSTALSLQASGGLQQRVDQVADTYRSARLAASLLLSSTEANNLLHEIVTGPAGRELKAQLVAAHAEELSKNMTALRFVRLGDHERMVAALGEAVGPYVETLRYVEKIVTASAGTGHDQDMDVLVGLLERAQKQASPIRLTASQLANSLAATARKGESETQFVWYGYMGAAAGLLIFTLGVTLGRRRAARA